MRAPPWAPAALCVEVFFASRRLLVLAVHLVLWAASFVGAFVLRFDFSLEQVGATLSGHWLAVLLALRAAVSLGSGALRGLWRYTSLRDLHLILASTTLATALFALALCADGFAGFPRSILVIDWLGCIILVGGLRGASRALQLLVRRAQASAPVPRRVLVVGAGHAGEALLRELQTHPEGGRRAVGCVADGAGLRNGSIHGVRVLGPTSAALAWARKRAADEIMVVGAALQGAPLRELLCQCRPAGLPVRVVPGPGPHAGTRGGLDGARPVAIEDLLGRPPVRLDEAAVDAFVRGKTVLITGAGGSIGSGLCAQVSRFAPRRLVLVEQAEQPLFALEQQLERQAPGLPVAPYIADIRDRRRMHSIMLRERPALVLHAAAHKHVPMMERDPGEAVKNNALGTQVLADLADACNVAHFVMISTDKAVNPSSVMGATKRVAEMYVQALGERSDTCFSMVRFGNVLGSQGSVVPTFRAQIAAGGPVTITHAQMRRYFMTVREACQLVLQAAALGSGGELFLLDMGAPVRIYDLAHDLITLSGLIPGEDIAIEETGMRPGEKLFEELHVDSERVDRTSHPKIFIGRACPPAWQAVRLAMAELAIVAERALPAAQVRAALGRIVPEYRPPGRSPGRELATPRAAALH